MSSNFQVHKRGPMWPLGGPDSDRSKSFGRQRRGVCYCRAWLSFELMGPCKQATATLFFWDDECAHLHVVCEQHFSIKHCSNRSNLFDVGSFRWEMHFIHFRSPQPPSPVHNRPMSHHLVSPGLTWAVLKATTPQL